MRRAKRKLKKNDFDEVVLEGSFLPLEAFKNRIMRKKYGGHVWFHAHLEPSGGRIRAKKEYENLRGVIGVSDYICKRYEQLEGYTNPKTYLLMNYVDHDLFYPKENKNEMRRRYGLSESDFVVLFTGRLSGNKGIDKLIKAFGEVIKEKPNSKLVVVGSTLLDPSSYVDELRNLADGIKDNVVFTGYVDHSEMADVYALADVVCLPSTWQEPAGLTMLESLCCAKPLITTNSGGIPEYVGDGAVVLPLGDNLIGDISKTIIYLQNHPEKLNDLSRKGYERSLSFTKEAFYKGFVDIFSGDKE